MGMQLEDSNAVMNISNLLFLPYLFDSMNVLFCKHPHIKMPDKNLC